MLKKIMTLVLTLALTLSLAACTGASSSQTAASGNSTTAAQTDETSAPNETETAENESSGEGKTLIVYFSWSGNTVTMAEYIHGKIGNSDMLEIEPETPYSDVYEEVGEVAKEERDSNARPAIANLPESLDDYDNILIGYPIWWHTAPMIIGTFLESYDLTEKNVYPFSQSASMDTEQFENSMEFVRQCAGNAAVHDGLFADESDAEAIDAYLESNGLN